MLREHNKEIVNKRQGKLKRGNSLSLTTRKSTDNVSKQERHM